MNQVAKPEGPNARAKGDIVSKARALGFSSVAIARADLPLEEEFERYRSFLSDGMQGEMAYLGENVEARRRLDTTHILEGAKSVICLARSYKRSKDDEANDPPFAQAIARYARGRDYHKGLRRKIRHLASYVRSLGTEDAPVSARPLCDDAPILERAWAARAGLGFVGKNGLLIVPGEGSFVLLGEVVTTLELPSDSAISERCGACTRCLDACPTQAFARPFVLDPRRCISYLTIELRSPIDESLRNAVGDHLFGCDDCQLVCPFNASSRSPPKDAVEPFEPLERWDTTTLESLLSLDGEAWQTVSEGTPLRRATQDGLARNAAILLARSADDARALEAAASGHPSSMVRDAAAWSLHQIENRANARLRTASHLPHAVNDNALKED